MSSPTPQYVGAAACSSSNCHGSVTARLDSAMSLQNEYVTWYKSDRHAKAYETLSTDRALRIARLVGMVDGTATPGDWLARAARPERCLDCHALDVPAAQRGPKFKLEDGVSCEACHGPAGGWLTRHTERGWEPSQSLALGMRETSDPGTAAEICMGCHLGTAARQVDHALLAAGHPTLVFELDTFGINMPVHWKEHDGNRRWFRGGAWAAGQAIGLRDGLRHLVRQARERGWPDFAAYECSACHHDLRRPTWRQQRGFPGRTPGTPALDSSRHALLPLLARAVGSSEAGTIRTGMERVGRLASDARPPREVAARAEAVVAAAERVLGDVEGAPLGDEQIRRLLRDIVDTAEPLAYGGFRTAQQAAWALDALAVAHIELERGVRPAAPDDPLRGAIGRLFDALKDPGSYDPARFARDTRALRVYLP